MYGCPPDLVGLRLAGKDENGFTIIDVMPGDVTIMRTNMDGKNLEIVRQPFGILKICVNPDVDGPDTVSYTHLRAPRDRG